jgi:hypothetical protein
MTEIAQALTVAIPCALFLSFFAQRGERLYAASVGFLWGLLAVYAITH